MADRIQINVPTYMPVEGQWQIIYPGSVIDVPSAVTYRGPTTILSPTETAAPVTIPTPVRNVRKR